MNYLVIAYPEFEQADLDWIQDYRSRHDRQFSLVKPHFSMVFGVPDMDKDSFLNEVRRQASGIKPFDIDIEVATIVQYHSGSHYQEFLVPDTGYSNMVKLHDRLYSGSFAPYLRFDITYIPHITIGDSDDPQASKRRIDELNTRGMSIHGRIGSIDVIKHADGVVSTVEKITLV